MSGQMTPMTIYLGTYVHAGNNTRGINATTTQCMQKINELNWNCSKETERAVVTTE